LLVVVDLDELLVA